MSENSKTILVVDDEPDVVKYLCTLLEDNGFKTLSEGDRVNFEVEETDRGPSAKNVEKL